MNEFRLRPFFVYCGLYFDFSFDLKLHIINKASKAYDLKYVTKSLKRRVFVCSFTFNSHSKTACRGFKSFCPCQKTVTVLVTVSLYMVNLLIQSIFRPRFSQCRIGNYKVGKPACRNCKPYKCNAEMRCKNQCYG